MYIWKEGLLHMIGLHCEGREVLHGRGAFFIY